MAIDKIGECRFQGGRGGRGESPFAGGDKQNCNPACQPKVFSGMLPEEISEALSLYEAFRAKAGGGHLMPVASKQIFKWIMSGATSFDEMTNISKSLRSELNEKAVIRTMNIAQRLDSNDGTVKLQLQLSDGAMIESVIITDAQGRKTVCLSSQAGCGCGCAFCMTGTLGFLRNLEAHEIVEQFIIAEGAAGAAGAALDNAVFMGMGEPMLNLDAVRKAMKVLADKRARAFSLRRITISTCGIIKGIDDLAQNGPHIRLAVSLTAADEDLRQKLMPIAKNNPLPALRDAIARYALSSGRRVTLEAALLGGVNTGRDSAKRLIDFTRGLNVNVNLIPWNAVDELPFAAPSPVEVRSFANALLQAALNVTVRAHHGRDVLAACGQLGYVPRGDAGGAKDDL